ncbi:THUMP domain-containing class I SAM-dependent RNA methyltransferase [Acidovorax cavernicola]|uniref:Class I SAM-dependent RNA methyltransferase n=1 Tax=Acidovorax cavernicola TaxID=1675792 RepID=A0A9X8D4Y6_9BURK|nr:THUMP domain-containing protein [Acidovorax cavernicola]RIX79848.1 class I SAM-dependent RNA methyltransferase [Acidovorax cavernicola]
MNDLSFFLPCAAGVEEFLAQEVHALTGRAGQDLLTLRGGVRVRADWRDALKLNLHSRLAQRVLVELAHGPYRSENDLYAIASGVAWEIWFTPKQTFKIETTAQHSPLQSLNFATLRIKDAVADRFRAKAHGVRPSIETQWPDCRIFAHLTTDTCTLYIDTSGEPLFKRGWRQDKGDAPLKETLAAAMLAASGWWNPETGEVAKAPLYDPCCGSGTIAIEAAQIASGIAAGSLRRFGFEKLLPFQAHVWTAIRSEAEAAAHASDIAIFGSDVSHRMVDFAQRNAERAGVAGAVEFRGGDALQRMPPAEDGVIMLNPPYGERIEVGGVARSGARETAQTPREGEDGVGEFFPQLATHWKKNYAGWTAWVLTPDLKLPKQMRLKESRRVPMWNGPIECRLFRFDMVRGSNRAAPQDAAT